MDLNEHGTIPKAINGSAYVVHTAISMKPDPTEIGPEYQEEVMKQTYTILLACQEFNVKRIVFTNAASNATECPPSDGVDNYTEEAWSDAATVSQIDPLLAAKLLSEQMQFEFIKDEGVELEIVSLCPTMVVGPTLLSEVADKSSAAYIRDIIEGKLKTVPHIKSSLVDVRDVAKAHYLAITVPEAANQRFLLSSGSMWLVKIS